MADSEIRFEDGAAYERMMGKWSLIAGEQFIDWIDVPKKQHWLDIGCGNGAFTELIVQRCAPANVQAFDPAPAQLEYARKRLHPDAPVTWLEAGAMQLPVPDAQADAAVMALVLFFVPDPAAGVAEMCRAVRSGGTVAAYHWDILNGGFPLAAIGAELLKLGVAPKLPPSAQASTLEASTALWQGAGLQHVRTCQITVQRRFDSIDDYWDSAASSNTIRGALESMSHEQRAALKDKVRQRLQAGEGELMVSARANAICGTKP